jgi:hypothetical protein
VIDSFFSSHGDQTVHDRNLRRAQLVVPEYQPKRRKLQRDFVCPIIDRWFHSSNLVADYGGNCCGCHTASQLALPVSKGGSVSIHILLREEAATTSQD